MALFLDQQHLAIVTPYQHGCKAGPLVLPSTMISPSYSPGYTIFGITAYVNFLDLKGSCGVNQGSTWFSRLFFVVVFTGILSTNSPRTPVVWVLGGEKWEATFAICYLRVPDDRGWMTFCTLVEVANCKTKFASGFLRISNCFRKIFEKKTDAPCREYLYEHFPSTVAMFDPM